MKMPMKKSKKASSKSKMPMKEMKYKNNMGNKKPMKNYKGKSRNV